MCKKVLALLFGVALATASHGQFDANKASEEELEASVLGLLGSDPDSARALHDLLEKRSIGSQIPDVQARITYLDAALLARTGHLAEALTQIERADSLPISDNALKAKIKNFLGRIRFDNDVYDEAIAAYLELLALGSSIDSVMIAVTYNNLGRVYERIKDYDRAFRYIEQSIAIYLAIGDANRAAGSLLNLGVVRYELQQLEKAQECFHNSLAQARVAGNEEIASIALESLGNVLRDQDRPTEALIRYSEAMSLSEKLRNPIGIASVSRNIGELYLKEKRPAEAIPFLERTLAEAEKIHSPNYRKDAYFFLAQAYKGMDQPAKALAYMEQYNVLKDSIMSEDRNRQIGDLQVKIESEKQERQITEQTLRLQRNAAVMARQTIWNRAAFGSVAALLIVGGLFLRNHRQKQLLAQERIRVLQQKNRMASMQAMIQGEERERTRIARDLHDGLNGTLATVKMYVSGLSETTPELASNEKFTRLQGILDDTTNEVRRISHDLMPNVLLRSGLMEAMREYCGNIERAGLLKVELITSGHEERLNERFELTLYRIIQELMNNIIKHANAKHVTIQLYRLEDVLHVTVEDDGDGFDPATAKNGLGLESIRSRVALLDGNSEIQSGPGMGTSVHMEFHLHATPSGA